MTTRWIRLAGRPAYADVLALQERLVEARLRDAVPDTVLLLEHPETITVGRHRGASASVLAPDGVPVVEVSRGGDATWHAPGQLVVYPIVLVPEGRRDVHAVLRALEEAVIGLLGERGLVGERDARNTGVWIDGHKVCSIGIALRQWVVWHGLALNVDVDLAGFARIRPCGFSADVMTRWVDHQPGVTVDALVLPLARRLADTLGLTVPDDVVSAAVADVLPAA